MTHQPTTFIDDEHPKLAILFLLARAYQFDEPDDGLATARKFRSPPGYIDLSESMYPSSEMNFCNS